LGSGEFPYFGIQGNLHFESHALRSAFFFLFATFVAVAYCQEEGAEPQEEVDEGIEQDALSSEQIRSLFAKIDADSDGKIAMPEIVLFSQMMRKTIAKKDIQSVLDEMDADKDGKLSLEELLKDMDQWGEESEADKAKNVERKDLESAKFKAADQDGDGFLNVEELPSLFYPETHDAVLELTAAATMKAKDKDGNGDLSPKEFWEGDAVDGEDVAVSEEEQADFNKLDTDSSGTLSIQELKAWESGGFHTEEAMKKMFELADKDSDLMITADEFDAARELIAGSDAQYHLMEWAEHNEL
jgi:Ca2+-binding EF-hand superfamily protein